MPCACFIDAAVAASYSALNLAHSSLPALALSLFLGATAPTKPVHALYW